MTNRSSPLSPQTIEASRSGPGSRIQLARHERRWTQQELADRAGIPHVTMRKVEHGDLSVGLGVAFEAAALVGVPLFDDDRSRLRWNLDASTTASRAAAAARAQADESRR